ncbi:uncharacterized protein LOC133711453 [Rosa rugosa]|uniref:uncharacterized protein LOC133711453 n=1 Tax=Rosa rugosa TaxID=74645 RepID=UPI002B4138A7|nr:uncharacterized protein LOC133711453 [Rosa rugosa]
MASSIDAVTASFATSLALAGEDVVDISRLHGSAPQRISQSLLLAKPLTAKPFATSDLQRHFQRVWVLDSRFKVQERAHKNFVFAFDLRKDRNRVLWGGPWYFNRTPMIIQEYDGLMAPGALKMDSLFFWVRIENIPPALEVKQTIINVASVAGKFLDIDKKLFDNTGNIRVRVSHEISRPFFLKRTLKLAPGIVEEISYFFENLNGVCQMCHLILHENGTCRMAAQSDLLQDEQMKEGTKLDLPNPF